MCNIRISFLSPVGAARELAHGAQVSELKPQDSKFCAGAIIRPNDQDQRWEPAAPDPRIASDLNGWLPSAACCGSATLGSCPG